MKTTATINPEQGYVTSTVDFADVHVTSASMADLSAPLSPRVLRGMADPSLAYKERYGGYGSRSEWEEAEYDLWEPGVVEDTESYFRQFIRKKKGLAFKEGYEFVGRDSDTIDYIHDRFMWLETAQGKSMRLLFKETMHELLQKSNSYWFKVRDDKASNGKMRTVAGRTLKPVAGYFIAPAETVQIKRKNNGTIVRARQLMPDGKYGKEYGKYDVVHFTLDKKVGHPAGTPIVEPVKDDIRTLRRMEEHVDLLVYQHLFPLFQYVVGTDQRPARVLPNGTDEIGIVEQKVEYLPPEGVIVTPERHEIKLIGADGKALKADTYLKHFKERVFAGIGMSSVDFGEGAGASRATANTLSGNTIDDVKDIQDDLEMQFNWQVLRELLLESKFPYNAIHRDHKVQLHFKEINLDAKIAYENHIAQMYEQYIFNEDEARHEIGREPKAIDDEEYREKTFWKMIKEPETIYLAGDETMTAASVSNPNTSVDEADLKRGEQMKESENKRQIVAKKATASAGERSGAASNRPSNQHGKANGPKTRDFISMAGHMIDDGFSTILNDVKGYQATNAPIYWTESVITLWKDRLIEQFSILAADTFSEGCKKYGVDPHTGYLGLNRLDAVRDRTAFYINKLASDLKARVGRLQGDETQKEAMTLIEIHKGRLDGIYKTELTKALNFGHLHGMQVRGLSHAKVVAGDCCEKCKAHDGKKIELATATLDNIASFHTNCTCGYEPTAVVKDSVSFEDSVQTRLYERHLGLPDSQKAMVLRDWIPPKRNVLAVAFGDFIESSNYKVLDTQRFDAWTGKKVALGYIDVEIEPGEYKEVIFGAHYFVKDETGSPLVIQTSFGGFSPSIIIHCLPNRRPAAKKFLDAFDKYTSENNFLRGHLIDPRGQFINTDKINMDDVILENEVKEEIKRRAVDFLGNLPLYVKNNQPTKRGILLEGPPGTGKASANSANILTPNGFKKMGDIKPNDFVIGSDGKEHRVISVHPQGKQPILRVSFTDGASTRVTPDHLWSVQNTYGTEKLLTTREIYGNERKEDGYDHVNQKPILKYRYRIPQVLPVEFAKSPPLSIPPYILGLLLGDGCLTGSTIAFSSADEELVDSMRQYTNSTEQVVKQSSKYDYYISKGYKDPTTRPHVRNSIDALNLHGKTSSNKFVPDIYLYASVEDRHAMLQGLMDTDGNVSNTAAEFVSVSKQLANDVMFLARSLGGYAKLSVRLPEYVYKGAKHIGKLAYRVRITMPNDFPPFRLSRKAEALQSRDYPPTRKIVKIEADGTEDATCILIDSHDHLYVTDDLILTHNTMLFKALSNEVGKDITCLWASAGDMDGSREVSWLYELARDMAPAVVFLEDIDTHGGKRNGGKGNPITGELLNQLDGMKSNSGIVTFASTNFIGHLDKALRDRPGRFDIKIHLGEPALPEIKKMLKAFFKNVIIDEAILDSIAEDVVGLTGAYLREIVMQAVSLAIDEDSLDDDDIAIVTLDHLTKAIGTVKHNKEQYSSEKYSDMTADEREAQGRIETCMTDMKTILRVKHPELSDIEINQKAFIACTSQTS